MVGIIWVVIMVITVLWATKKSWSQEDRVGKGLYIVLDLFTLWALYEIVMLYLTKQED